MTFHCQNCGAPLTGALERESEDWILLVRGKWGETTLGLSSLLLSKEKLTFFWLSFQTLFVHYRTNEPLLTQKELARVLKVSVLALKRLRREKKIPSLRIGHRTLRFSLPDVLEALKRGIVVSIKFTPTAEISRSQSQDDEKQV